MEPEALDYLLSRGDPLGHLKGLLEGGQEVPWMITLQDIHRIMEVSVPAPPDPPIASAEEEVPEPVLPSGRSPPRVEHDGDLKILRDITGQSTCQGKIEDFSKYFAHRFRVLSSFVQGQREMLGALPISKAKRKAKEVRFIGMVREVRTTKSGHRLLEMEDEEDSCAVLLTKEGPLAREPVVPDEVLGVVGNSWKDDLIIAETLVRPEVPTHKGFTQGAPPVKVAFVSDIHVGSRLFLKERWEAFLRWLRSGDEEARAIKYLVMVGDVVDGIGVYPRQDEDLLVDDVYLQYEQLSAYVNSMPEGLKTLILPGNHDAVRPAEPQPALPRAVQELFTGDVTFVGNPCLVSLHGVQILAYHGRSMDDFVSGLPGMAYDRPLDAMKEMLRRRHMAPIYGGKTPIAPEAKDHLIIDPLPDIFVTGHVHGLGTEDYRGIRLVNSSTWQAQTSYQRMHNIDPRPGRVVTVSLSDGEARIKQF
jgi:DNA polymerase II small subunit